MPVIAETLFRGSIQGFAEGAWAILLCGQVLVASVATTVFVMRRRGLAWHDGQAERYDQLFWDLFLGAAVALPALLIPALVSPLAGLFLAGAGLAAGVASYRGTPRFLARRRQQRENRALEAAHLAAQAQHDEVLSRWRRYELDPACSIDYPTLMDVRLPETSAFIKAMRTADELRSRPHGSYPDAVTRLAASLAAAERAAGIPR